MVGRLEELDRGAERGSHVPRGGLLDRRHGHDVDVVVGVGDERAADAVDEVIGVGSDDQDLHESPPGVDRLGRASAGQSVAASPTTRLSVSDDDSSPPRNAGSFSLVPGAHLGGGQARSVQQLRHRGLQRPEPGQAGDDGVGRVDGHAQHPGPIRDEQVTGRDAQRPDIHRATEPRHPHVVVGRHDTRSRRPGTTTAPCRRCR